MKKLLSLVLALVLAAGLLPMTLPASATSGSFNAISWDLNTVTGLLTLTGTGNMPNTWGLTTVPWASFRASIREVSISAGITSIGQMAFQDCNALTGVTIPEGVTSIGMQAFLGCTALNTINIPASVNTIGVLALRSSQTINVDPANLNFSSQSGVLFNKAGTTLIQYPTRRAGSSYTVPNGVTLIGDRAFQSALLLTGVTFPASGLLRIGEAAFQDCTALTGVNIPNGVTTIDRSAFHGCTFLTSVTIPNSVTSIGISAFDNCIRLTGVTLPPNITVISERLFNDCRALTGTINIPPGVTIIGNMAFANCTALSGVVIPAGVQTIDTEAFFGCTSLVTINIPQSVTTIGTRAFFACTKLTDINVNAANPNYADEGGVLFNKAKTTLIQYPPGRTAPTYTIPASVRTIRVGAFAHAAALTGMTIPETVTSIENNVFLNCTALPGVTILSRTVTFFEGQPITGWNQIPSFTITGYSGSTSEAFAKSFNPPYPFDDLPCTICDVKPCICCHVCWQLPCKCCADCLKFPCECPCSYCLKDPCECPCHDCGEFPCNCFSLGCIDGIHYPGKDIVVYGYSDDPDKEADDYRSAEQKAADYRIALAANTSRVGLTSNFMLNLTKEKAFIPESYNIAAYSTNGGQKWRVLKSGAISDRLLTRMLNKGMTLWITDEFNARAVKDGKTVIAPKGSIPENARVVKFQKIERRSNVRRDHTGSTLFTESGKAAVNYGIFENHAGGGWALSVKDDVKKPIAELGRVNSAGLRTFALMDSWQVGTAPGPKGKEVDEKGFGIFCKGIPQAQGGVCTAEIPCRGIPVKRLGDAPKPFRSAYIVGIAPTFEIKDGIITYMPASKTRRVVVLSERKAPNYRIKPRAEKLNKDGSVKTPASAPLKVRPGTYVSINDGEPTLYTQKEVINVLGVEKIELWQIATGKRPASSKQALP
jgi:hypothetical protein